MNTEAASDLRGEETDLNSGFAIDTTFVLFFLAVDLGQNLNFFRFDTAFLTVTLLAVLVLPYFAASSAKPDFVNWLFGRSLIVLLALAAGLMFRQSLGTILPDSFKFLPLTLVIVAAMISCYARYYSFLKLRLSK